jgi:PAS domain S-box-containing protein
MRQDAVEELNQFFALSREMMCVSDLDGFVRRANGAWEETLGFRVDEVCGVAWVDFVHPHDGSRAMAAFQRLQSGTDTVNLELRCRTKAGTYKWLVGSATAVLERGVVFTALRDISQRKDLEEQLRQKNASLQEQNRRESEASRMKSEFLANMSHELRSPLNGVIGFSELLYDGKLDPLADRPKEFIGRIHASATHLLHPINGVLDLSKVEAGRMDFRPEPVIVSTVVEEVVGIMGALAAAKQIQVQLELEGPKDVYTDPGWLKQVLYNYLWNALKFTGDGGRILVRLKAEGAPEFRLEVTDTGIGIEPPDLGRLFVEFQQLDATRAKRHQGTGLGLALTKRIVEAQGGRVGVESSPGQGSTFFAVLPCTPLPNSRALANILVIEDDKLGRFLITRILEGVGCRVDTAATCAEALEMCDHGSFDAITLDLILPDVRA